MIKRILVPLDLSPYSLAASGYACAIAKRHRAVVTGMAVLDTPEITGVDLPFHASLLPYTLQMAAERTEDAKARIADALKRFAETCESQGVGHTQAEFQGVPSDRILETAAFYDLLIMGLRTFFHFETQAGAGDSLQRVLNRCSTPVLAVPSGEVELFKNVVVAFDGSPHAVRALRALVAFEPVYDFNVTVVMSDDDSKRAEFYLGQAAAFLRAHGFAKLSTVATGEEIGDVIDRDYIEDADLVVAGVHAKHAVRDFFVGSLTKRLIDYGHTALLLGQ
jgi:nucleotide-binding universal stress UspA family protein